MSAYVVKAKALGADMVYASTIDGSTWLDQAGTNDLTIVGASNVVGGGPGVALPDALFFDGSDDYALRDSGNDPDFDLGASGDGWLCVALWSRWDTSQESWATLVSKGDDTYQIRRDGQTSDGWRDPRWDVRGGTGDNELAGFGSNIVATDTWVFIVAQQDDLDGHSQIRIRVYESDGTLIGEETSARSGTVGTDNDARFLIGGQDSDGDLRRFWEGRITGVALFRSSYLTFAEHEELRAATFETGRFTLDFSALTTGANPPELTLLRAHSSDPATYSVVEDESYLDGKAVLLSMGSSSDFTALGIDATEGAPVGDFDLVYHVVDGDHDSNWTRGAFCEFFDSDIDGRFHGVTARNLERLRVFRSGSGTGGGWSEGSASDSDPNTPEWYRFRRVGDVLMACRSGDESDIMLDGSGEPSMGWQATNSYPIETTEPTSPFGFAAWSSGTNQYYDYFSVAWGVGEHAESPSQSQSESSVQKQDFASLTTGAFPDGWTLQPFNVGDTDVEVIEDSAFLDGKAIRVTIPDQSDSFSILTKDSTSTSEADFDIVMRIILRVGGDANWYPIGPAASFDANNSNRYLAQTYIGGDSRKFFLGADTSSN